MPELPEVETVARGLDQRIAGDTIELVWLGSKPEPLKSPAAEIEAALQSRTISRVRRVGKHIVFDLEATAKHKRHSSTIASQWIVHLGMTGSLRVSAPEQEIEKHTHAILKLSSGRELRFIDPRRFGRLSVIEKFEAPGLEPLQISCEDFAALFRGRKTPIKSALLNQKLLSGVGNIYADEALFRAGIRPRRRAGSLNRDELKRLHAALTKVLKEAIRLGGSSISDYVDADGEEGFFQLKHRVYGREGKPCLVCKTPIKRIVIAGRSSHYCPHCQK
ncbi:MAG TPA: bifunctional DNA-formamidopyrimidine glycosylase/DNA-(apurinic or apyrimidinic site) lyase [Terriglobales bacterium]|jgi:formamidopyrimidine-DNA glycosylase|nr:bifunctional DNA-formamidopyrimidine glycosylase/DNA-(apurinic or apyrimidinic site) lyase [Terriglobales bacterium]